MSIKIVLLLVIAFVGIQYAESKIFQYDTFRDRIEPLNQDLSVPSKIIHSQLFRSVTKILIFPLLVIFRGLRFILTPIRVLLAPVRLVARVIRFILYPFKKIIKSIVHVLSVLPIVKYPVKLVVQLFKVIILPLKVIRRSLHLVFGY